MSELSVLDRCERIGPPRELTAAERKVWVTVVNTQPADWLSDANAALLIQYCRHVVDARRVAQDKEKIFSNPGSPVQDRDCVLKMQERESRIILILATQMCLTQRSTTNHRGNKKTTIQNNQPWQETA